MGNAFTEIETLDGEAHFMLDLATSCLPRYCPLAVRGVPSMRPMREYLQENKIFFETAAAMLLSAMAIIVAIANLFIAIDQRNLTQIQTKVAENNALPRFEINDRPIFNSKTGKFDNSNLQIENNGGAIRDFQAHIKVFMSIEAGKGGGVLKNEIPLAGLFGTQIIGSAGTGNLSTFLGHRNNANRSELQQKIRVLGQENGLDFANVNFKTFIKIQYTDLLDRLKLEYYELRGVGYASKMSYDEGSNLFPEKLTELPVEISEIDTIKLINDLKNKLAR